MGSFTSEQEMALEKAVEYNTFLLEVAKNLNCERINITSTGKLQMFMALSESIENLTQIAVVSSEMVLGEKSLRGEVIAPHGLKAIRYLDVH